MPRRRVPSVGLSASGSLQNCHKRIPTLVLNMKSKNFARNTNVRLCATIRRFRFNPRNLGGYLLIEYLSAETALVTVGSGRRAGAFPMVADRLVHLRGIGAPIVNCSFGFALDRFRVFGKSNNIRAC